MNGIRLVATSLMTATLLAATAHAMDIKDYFRLVATDQARFDQTLLDTAEQELRDKGRPDLVRQLDKLFTEIKPGDSISEGMHDYMLNLSDMLRAELKREEKNPNLPHLQAERAFRDVASDHNIPLPKSFDDVAARFKRQYPLTDLVKEREVRGRDKQ
jgi:hypothetical protein